MYNKSILTGCLLLLAVMLAGCSQPPTSKPNHMITCTWNKLPDLPGMADTASLGVSAPFVGISNGILLVAGGCNFPDKPVTEGGAKRCDRTNNESTRPLDERRSVRMVITMKNNYAD